MNQPTHLVILTMGSQTRTLTMDAAITPQPGTTRRDLLHQALAELAKRDPSMTGGSVLFFSVEPNQL